MIADALDILNPRERFSAEGTYWDTRPDSAAQGGSKKFNYEFVSPYSKTYRVAFGNMQTFEAGETTVRTNDDVGFQNGGFVMLQNGQLYTILQVATDFQAASKQALRFLGVPLGTEYILRMVNVENPWGAR